MYCMARIEMKEPQKALFNFGQNLDAMLKRQDSLALKAITNFQ